MILALALATGETSAKSPGVVDSIKNFLGFGTTTTTTTTEDPSKANANADDAYGAMYGGMYPGMGMMDPGMFGDYGGYYDSDGNKIDDDKNEELRKKKK